MSDRVRVWLMVVVGTVVALGLWCYWIGKTYAYEVPVNATPVVAYPDATWQARIDAQATQTALLVQQGEALQSTVAALATQVAAPTATPLAVATGTAVPTVEPTQAALIATATAVRADLEVQGPYAESKLLFAVGTVGLVVLFVGTVRLLVTWLK